MKKIILFLLLASSVSLSCHKDLPSGLEYKTMIYDGLERRYAVYVPGNVQTSPPIVFVLHGGGGNIDFMTGNTSKKSPYKLWMDVADENGFIVVYPQATDNDNGKPTWNDCRQDCQINSGADDEGFMLALIDTMVYSYNADTTRIYFTGMSNGGFMSLRMAVQHPEKLAAVAPVCASLPAISKCKEPSEPLPIMFINGTEDPLLPYDGGTIGNPPNETHGTAMPVEDAVNLWIKLDSCSTDYTYYEFPDLDTKDKSTVVKYVYPGGKNNTEVVFYKVIGGGHAIPSIAEQYSWIWETYVGKQNHDIEAVYEIWNFFADKRKVY